MKNQLNRGQQKRLMYIENKDGLIFGEDARIGWVTFTKSGQGLHYRGRLFLKGQGIGSNFFDAETGEGYWISGVKKRGSNVHYAEVATVIVDDDAKAAFDALRSKD